MATFASIPWIAYRSGWRKPTPSITAGSADVNRWRPDPCVFTMSRFGNLEFEGDEHQEVGAEQKLPVKDESYYRERGAHRVRNGQFEPALRYYSKILEFNLTNTAAWAGQVRMLIELANSGRPSSGGQGSRTIPART